MGKEGCSLLIVLITLLGVDDVSCCCELSRAVDPPEDVPVEEVVEDEPPLEEEWE